MAHPDWRDSVSEEAKANLIEQEFGGWWGMEFTGCYLFYVVDCRSLSPEEFEEIRDTCFVDPQSVEEGDIEFHTTFSPPRLRLRSMPDRSPVFLKRSLRIRGQYCALLRIEQFHPRGPKCLDFQQRWELRQGSE